MKHAGATASDVHERVITERRSQRAAAVGLASLALLLVASLWLIFVVGQLFWLLFLVPLALAGLLFAFWGSVSTAARDSGLTRRRKIAMTLAILAILGWTSFFVVFMPLQGFPPVLEQIESGARFRVFLWLLWLSGVTAGVGLVVALWRTGRDLAAISKRERLTGMALIVGGVALWTVLMVAAQLLDSVIYPVTGDMGEVARPYAATARVLLAAAWLLGIVVAVRMLLAMRRLPDATGQAERRRRTRTSSERDRTHTG
jgi:MFS family permease